jgi:citronellyl-CoA dehydrogenase
MLFSYEHEELRNTVRSFIEREINPHVDRWEDEKIFPARELFTKMGKLGLLGATKPQEYGGLGLDYSYGLVIAEELGGIHCGAIPMAIGVQTDMATPALARYGSDELRKQFLAPAISGEMVACIAVSETQAGSDVAGIKTYARSVGDDYVINGSKMWITSASQGDFACLLANTSEGHPHKNKSLIIVPLDTPGITISKRLQKLGMHSSDTVQIFFEDVKVPRHYRIGDEGAGFSLQMQQFQEERMHIAASTLRALEYVITQTAEYCSQRSVFGKNLIENQVIQFRLSELQTEIECVRSLIYRACELYINGEDVTLLASMAKLKSGRLSREVSDSCLQYWGGMGYMWENPASRAYRDMRLGSIGGGADEIMLSVISRILGYGRKRNPGQ